MKRGRGRGRPVRWQNRIPELPTDNMFMLIDERDWVEKEGYPGVLKTIGNQHVSTQQYYDQLTVMTTPSWENNVPNRVYTDGTPIVNPITLISYPTLKFRPTYYNYAWYGVFLRAYINNGQGGVVETEFTHTCMFRRDPSFNIGTVYPGMVIAGNIRTFPMSFRTISANCPGTTEQYKYWQVMSNTNTEIEQPLTGWHNLTLVALLSSSIVMKMYIDGVYLGEYTENTGATFNYLESISIGNKLTNLSGQYNFRGEIATYAAWNRALSESEVSAIWTYMKHKYGLR